MHQYELTPLVNIEERFLSYLVVISGKKIIYQT